MQTRKARGAHAARSEHKAGLLERKAGLLERKAGLLEHKAGLLERKAERLVETAWRKKASQGPEGRVRRGRQGSHRRHGRSGAGRAECLPTERSLGQRQWRVMLGTSEANPERRGQGNRSLTR